MKTVRVNDVDLAYVDRGRGPTVLLVHGFPLDHRMWEGQVAALSDNYRVIAPDLRGFGRSGATAGTVTMERFADDLAAVLDAAGVAEPVVLVGLSMGGYIALRFWKRHRGKLRALALCDTRASADSPEAAAARRETAQRVLREGAGFLAESMTARLLAPDTPGNRPDVVGRLRRMATAAHCDGIAAALRGMAQRADFTGMLAEIACPTLVVVGRHDAISPPSEMAAMARAIPGARLVEIDGAGHMTPMEEPERFNAAIGEFLASVVGHQAKSGTYQSPDDVIREALRLIEERKA